MEQFHTPTFSTVSYKDFIIQIKTNRDGTEEVQVVLAEGKSPTTCKSVQAAKRKITEQITLNYRKKRKENVNI